MLIVAIMGLPLAGCQHQSTSDATMPSQSWRVMESIGDVRTTRDDGLQSARLRAGETIGDNLPVTTSDGSLLILSRNGYQLTAGENTSFRLPAANATSDLFLDHGWLRIRIANPVNREIRIKTARFDINAAKATLNLRADPNSANLTVEAGSAVLATTDGRHRATLVAGATAKMDPMSGNDLLIQPGSAQGFSKASKLSATTRPPSSDVRPTTPDEAKSQPATAPSPDGNHASIRASRPGDDQTILPASRPKKAPPLPTTTQHPGSDLSPAAPEKVKSQLVTASSPDGNPASIRASRPENGLIILPASRLKKPDDNRPKATEPVTNATRSPKKTGSISLSARLSKRPDRSPMERSVIPSSMPEGNDDRLQDSRPHQEDHSPAFDPLQFQFDQMTEGLLDGL